MIVIEIAEPAPGNFRAPLSRELPAGTELHRIHHGDYGSCQFNETAHGNARFSPIRDARGAIIPTIYAGQSFRCASCEIILRAPDAAPDPGALTVVSPQDFEAYQHSAIQTRRDLQLVDLTALGQRAVGVMGNALLSGGTLRYPSTRAWAEAIHSHVRWAEGIFYTSYQCGPEFAMVLFGDRCPDTLDEIAPARPVRAASVEDEIRAIGEMIGIEYVDI